jgi:antitoxin (DNA-binding transcriptional repressor) of toxin-antitoxin stability system
MKHETIIINRKGKPVAQLTPIPTDTYKEESVRFPLRTVSISIAENFDEPDLELWEALES